MKFSSFFHSFFISSHHFGSNVQDEQIQSISALLFFFFCWFHNQNKMTIGFVVSNYEAFFFLFEKKILVAEMSFFFQSKLFMETILTEFC